MIDLNFPALLCVALAIVGVIVGFLGDVRIDSEEAAGNMRRDPEDEIVLGRSLFTSPAQIRFNSAHFWYSAKYKLWATERDYCAHSPQSWPWWRWVSFNWVRLEICKPNVGWRLWVYTRWGALYWDITFDRRIKNA